MIMEALPSHDLHMSTAPVQRIKRKAFEAEESGVKRFRVDNEVIESGLSVHSPRC